MILSTQHAEQTAAASSLPAYRRVQNRLLAICILLAPLTLTVYLMTWINVNAHGSSLDYSQSIAALGPVLNYIHMISGILATIFLPLGFLGMALLGMKRAPWLATISAIFALVGWAPFGAIISLDILAYDVARVGSMPQLVTLWGQFNGDPFIMTYQYIYIVGHMISAILLGILLGRTRLIPVWTAWAFALSSPVTMLLFAFHQVPQLVWIVCVLFIIGAVPAALALWRQ
ncbi:hypothetical protein [Dictyobacter kobayashii]|uniref:DUF4386 domain-containing protein n=1 Tax=Dictyobacter kobayashii TaxID=2014872 RepID=A0A402ANN3_9CHLR|nr:hypothetical protein [Dictyobacter kobayashii]GCE20811.1 hypothetical protein KDK_46110 [Dictyobacter kobayashii]